MKDEMVAKRLQVVVTSWPDREDFVAEILDEPAHKYIGYVHNVGSVVHFTYFDYQDGDYTVELADLLEALQYAELRLRQFNEVPDVEESPSP